MHANDKATGRNWYTADTAKLHDFGDCFRAHIYWDDGAEAYTLHDTKAEAVDQLNRLGFQAK
jgi:hypothetical protein